MYFYLVKKEKERKILKKLRTNHHLKGVKGVDNSHERYTKRGMTAVPLLSGGLFKNRESYCVNEFGYGNVYVNNSNAIIAKLEQLRP